MGSEDSLVEKIGGGASVYHIGICDDDKIIAAEIERILLAFSKEHGNAIQVDVYSDGSTLLDAMNRNEYYDLIFLDIEMKHKSGMETGAEIRNVMHNEFTHLVFISAFTSYAMELFKIRPLDFLVKPFQEQDVIETLKKSMELSAYEGHTFLWKKGWETRKTLLRDILYFCSRNRQVEMHTKDGVEVFYGSLEKVYQRLANWRFFYCHQGYLVNYNQVTEFKYDQLTLKNGEIIGIAQGKRKQVRAMVREYLKEDI